MRGAGGITAELSRKSHEPLVSPSANNRRGGPSRGRKHVTMFTRPAHAAEAAPPGSLRAPAADDAPVKRPPAWALSNWPVGYKVVAIVLVPLGLARGLAALRVKDAMANSGDLRLAATRADVLPAITKYMSALDVALLASSTGRDEEGAKKNYEARKGELQARLAHPDWAPG